MSGVSGDSPAAVAALVSVSPRARADVADRGNQHVALLEPLEHFAIEPIPQADAHLALDALAVDEHLGHEEARLRIHGDLRRHGGQQHILGRGDDAEHLCRHLRHERAVVVVDIDQHGVEHDLAGAACRTLLGRVAPALVERRGRRGQYLPHGAVPASRPTVGLAAQCREIDRHARLHMTDVRLRDLRPHGHMRQVGDAHDQRGLVGGVQRLAFARVERDHGAGHRRVDARVAELRLVPLERGRGAVDLRMQVVDLGEGDVQIGLCGLNVFKACRTVGHHLLLTPRALAGQ